METAVASDAKEPVWDEAVELGVNLAEPATLRVEIFDKIEGSDDELVASGIMDLNRVVPGLSLIHI